MRPQTMATLSVLTLSSLYTPCQAGLEYCGGHHEIWSGIRTTESENEPIENQEGYMFDGDGHWSDSATSYEIVPNGGICQAGAEQDVTVTDGSGGESLLKGHGSSHSWQSFDESHFPYHSRAGSYSYIYFVAEHPFQWIADVELIAKYSGDLAGYSRVGIIFKEDRGDVAWRYNHVTSSPADDLSQPVRASGMLPAGKYWLQVYAITDGNTDQSESKPGDGLASAAYEIDFRIKQRPVAELDDLYTGQWDRVTDTLLDLGKQADGLDSDLDKNGKIDVDDVISALESVLDKEAASDADTAKAKDEMPSAGAAGSSSKAATGKPAAGKK